MYKKSKFNYSCVDRNGDLLIYNTYHGYDNACKIKDKIIQEKFIKDESFSEDDECYIQLREKGILVDENLDENLKLTNLIYQNMIPSNIGLNINITEQCNFRCKYCYQSHENSIIEPKVKNNLKNYIKQNIHKYTGLSVSWFGGEPLLATDDIIELSESFIGYCNFNKRRYSASMTTNGYLLDIDTFKKLLRYGIDAYQITLDSTKYLHDKYRPFADGKPTFDVIFQNLENIKKIKNQNFHITIRTNVTMEIFDHLDEFINVISHFCDNDKRFSLSLSRVNEWSNSIEEDYKSTFITNTDLLESIYRKFLETDKFINLDNELNTSRGACQLGRENRYLVRYNGEIHKCSITFENKENIIGEFIDGKLILNDKYYAKMINPNNCPNAKDCYYTPICKGNTCPLGRKNSSNCPLSKKYLDLILQLHDKNKPFDIISI